METDVPFKRNHLHWFRNDLRFHDNPALLKALEDCENFYGVYILDTEAFSRCKTKSSCTVWRFFLQCLNDLDDKLRNFNSRLFVVKGSPLRVLPTLFEKWKVSRLTFNASYDLYSRERDEVVMSLATIANVEVVSQVSGTLFDAERYIENNGGNVPVSLKEFQKVFSSLGPVQPPVECVGAQHFVKCTTSYSDWLEGHFGVPKLEDLEFVDQSDTSAASFLCGGEDEGLMHFNHFIGQISTFEGKESPPPSKLSPYFRFGCLSVRHVYSEVHPYIDKCGRIAHFIRGLETRDFFHLLASRITNWDKVDGNPICLKIPWEENIEYLRTFRKGKTGFPWIDANIAKLKKEGWIDYEARQSLAYFLTRGCLWISWEEGVKFLEEYCIDAERSVNVGGWLWASGSSFFNSNFRAFCPVEEAKRLDPNGTLIRHYLPALRNFPNEYIHEPWSAPRQVQEKANCIIGKDYPDKMIDHLEARQACIEKMREFHKELIHPISSTGRNVVHWFRKDLRLHDNPALVEALRNGGNFYGVYIFDPLAFQERKYSINHGKFLLQCLRDLDAKLRECGSFLYVIRDSPMAAFKHLFVKWRVTKLTMEEDTEPYAQKLENSVVALAKKFDIQVVSKVSHTLYSIPTVVQSNDSLQPFTFKRFITTVKKIGQPDYPLPPLDAVSFQGCLSPIVLGYEMPRVEEFGMSEEDYREGISIWIGGESEALRRFDAIIKKVEHGLMEVDSFQDACFPKVTALSPYMRFGCISTRLIYHTLTKIQKKGQGNNQYILNTLMKLMFRDFLFTLGHRNFFFDEVKNNPICLQIPWESNGDFVKRWREATTGFPWIDAVQTQLRKEGWTNHLGRQAAACFLTRGCLWISWEEGFRACQEMQIDFEWSLCAANWLMISCSSFFVKCNKYYCPVNTGKQYDPQGVFIRKYIPQLRNFPAKYIYDPWNAPLEVQQAAGCIIGKDYPMRIIDHEEAKLVCAKRLREMVGEIREGVSKSISLGDDDDEFVAKKKKVSHDEFIAVRQIAT